MKAGLVLIDIQNDYFPGGKMELSDPVSSAHNAKDLLLAARSNKIPVIHVRHISTRPDATFFLPGTTGAEIHSLVSPLPGEDIVIKHYPNSFRDTDLPDIICRSGIDHLIICGMMTHMCVDATVRAAADLGYRCTLASDACTTRNLVWDGRVIPASDVHGAFLASLSGLYAQVCPTSVIVEGMPVKPVNRE
jgi:nicotinamidase-related amidase